MEDARRFRLRTSTVAFILVLAILAAIIIVIALQSYRAVDRELTDAALSRRASVASLAATTLSEKFARLTDIGIALATRVQFRQLLGAGKWAEAAGILKEIPENFPFIERLFLTDPGGTLMADVPERPEVRGQNFAQRDWYQGVSKNWEPYVSTVYQRAVAPRLNVFAVAVPIRSVDREVLGVLVLQVRLDTFFAWIGAVEMGSDSFVYVVDRRGQLASHPRFSPQGMLMDFSAVPVVRTVLQGKTGVEITFNPIESEERVSAYAPIGNYGWGVVAAQPVSSAFAAKHYQLTRILIAYGLILLLCVLMVYLVSRMVLQRRQAAQDRRVKAELERAVAERTAQLKEANRELESFTYSVSHDLRSPLRAIDGFSQILEEDCAGKLDGEGRRVLGVIRDSSRKMGTLIDDLLAFSRLGRQPITIAESDINALVQEVVNELRAVPGDIARHCVIGQLPAAWCDRAMLRQVWANLLSNAFKFAGKNREPMVDVGGFDDGAETVYSVKDNGVGFDMRYYDKLFGVFQRLHSQEEFPGTGVGLAIVQRIVTRHGGRVWAEGNVNAGATFYFALPKEI